MAAPTTSRRPIVWLLLAAAALAATLAGLQAAHVPVPSWLARLPQFPSIPGTGTPGKAANAPPEPEEVEGARVVAFGFVDVEGGAVPLSLPVLGTIAELAAKEGARVKPGEVLMKVRSVGAEQKLRAAEEVVSQAKVKLEQAQRAPAIYEQKLLQQGEALRGADALLEAAERELQAYRDLPDSVGAGRLESERIRMKALRAKRDAERHRLEEIKLEDPNELVRLALADVEKAKAQVGEAKELVDQHVLRAAESGVVLRVLVTRGQLLTAGHGQPAVWFRPDRKPMLRCEIAQEFCDRVSVGQHAEVFNDRLDGPRWRGKVVRCADWVGPRRSLLDEPLERNDVRTMEFFVELDPSQPPLRQGQRMRVVLADARGAAAR